MTELATRPLNIPSSKMGMCADLEVLLKFDWSSTKFSCNDDDYLEEQMKCILRHRLKGILKSRLQENKQSENDDANINEPQVFSELNSFVQRIAKLYHKENGYHAFDHAAHVTLSVNKLVEILIEEEKDKNKDEEVVHKCKKARTEYPSTHQYMTRNDSPTFGIGRDPLTQFALVFAALIHDVDHRGVPNQQLVDEKHELAFLYNDISVAEMRSLSVAFSVLKEKEFTHLEEAIASTSDEKKQFRKTVIELVLSTDISSPTRIKDGKIKWKEAFGCMTEEIDSTINNDMDKAMKQKASAVLDIMIQTADVAHTMQDWQTFVKWNEHLYRECIDAYESGRVASGAQDPSLSWYKGNIGFFNGYVIPLAQRMSRNGAFGERGHEFLNNAEENCKRWIVEGEKISRIFASRLKCNQCHPLCA